MLSLLSVLSVLAAPPPAPTHTLIGVVSEQATLTCEGPIHDAEERWGAPYFEAGFVRLVGVDGAAARAALGQPVVLEGAPAAGPPPAGRQPCRPLQMRSDWVYGKGGMRVKRTETPHVAFAVKRLTPAPNLLKAERITAKGKDKLLITVHNPLDRPLTDVEVTVHHEGCYGKPGSTARQHVRPTLGPGAAYAVRLPTFVDEKRGRGRVHRAAAVTLNAGGERVRFDLDVDLSALGVTVECPGR